jgi:hypothetical protein
MLSHHTSQHFRIRGPMRSATRAMSGSCIASPDGHGAGIGGLCARLGCARPALPRARGTRTTSYGCPARDGGPVLQTTSGGRAPHPAGVARSTQRERQRRPTPRRGKWKAHARVRNHTARGHLGSEPATSSCVHDRQAQEPVCAGCQPNAMVAGACLGLGRSRQPAATVSARVQGERTSWAGLVLISEPAGACTHQGCVHPRAAFPGLSRLLCPHDMGLLRGAEICSPRISSAADPGHVPILTCRKRAHQPRVAAAHAPTVS